MKKFNNNFFSKIINKNRIHFNFLNFLNIKYLFEKGISNIFVNFDIFQSTNLIF